MTNEVLIGRLYDIIDEVTRLGGEQERTSIVPGILVADASPSDLPTGYIKIVNPRDGTYVPCLTVNGLVVSDNDLVNVLFTKGTEPIALSQSAGSPSSGVKVYQLWESDFGAVAWQTNATGDLANVDGESLTLNDSTPAVKILLDPTVPSIAVGGTALSDSIHIQGAGSQGLRASNAANTIYTQLYTDGSSGFLRHTVPSGNANIFIDPIAPDPGDSNIQIWRNVNTGGGSIGIFMFAADGTATIRHQLRINDSSFFYQNDLTGTSGWGIGTTAMLDSARLTVRRDFTGTNGLVSLENQGDTTADRNVIVSFRHSAAIGAQIRAVRESGDADGMYLAFLTEPVGGSVTERMRITDGGLVGINNSSPQALLHVGAGTDAATIVGTAIYASNAGITTISARDSTNDVEVFMLAASGIGLFGTFTNTDFELRANNTRRLYIKASTGLVGINTAALAAQLHVDQPSTTAAVPVLYLDQADVSEEMIEFNTTIGTGNAIEAVGAKTLTTTHFIKVTLPGALTRYIPVGTIA